MNRSILPSHLHTPHTCICTPSRLCGIDFSSYSALFSFLFRISASFMLLLFLWSLGLLSFSLLFPLVSLSPFLLAPLSLPLLLCLSPLGLLAFTLMTSSSLQYSTVHNPQLLIILFGSLNGRNGIRIPPIGSHQAGTRCQRIPTTSCSGAFWNANRARS